MRIILFIVVFFSLLDAKSHLSSPVTLPKNYLLNTEIEPCFDACLQEYLEQEQIFSFLAHTKSTISSSALREAMMIYSSYFNLEKIAYAPQFKVALLLPYKKIGNYAVTTNNAVFAYLITKNQSFSLKTYYIEDENASSIEKALTQIQEAGISYVIAPLTLDGANAVVESNPNLNIFFPTIHKSDVIDPSKNLYFGGIDYDAQIQKLLQYAQGYTALFYDASSLGKRLNSLVQESIDPQWIRFSTSISRKKSNLKMFLKDNDLLQEGTIFVNTSTVHSGIVMSQLTLYNIQPAAILSTQINYNPLILSITQEQDRKNMYIANSIESTNNVLIEANRLLDNNIVYDRINYATTLGIDFFLSEVTSQPRDYSEPIQDNQIIYPVSIYQPTLFGFKKLSE